MNNDLNINPHNYVAHLTPGKFEGEQPPTEYFYEQMLNGDGEIIDANISDEGGEEDEGSFDIATIFHINADEAEAFNLPIGHTFLLWEDNQGFAYGEIYPTRSEAVRAFNCKI